MQRLLIYRPRVPEMRVPLAGRELSVERGLFLELWGQQRPAP
jgi:hypothetical protein